MAKKTKVPKNFYTAEKAIEKLQMSRSTFFDHVRKGKIKKVIPPGQKEGYYPKKIIDDLARARELVILEYAAEPSSFTRATDEDIKGIHDICASLFGISETVSYETMLSWQQKNPYTYFVTKQEGFVTGYFGFLYLNKEVTERIMSKPLPGVPMPPSTDIEPFIPGKPIHGLFIGLAVRPGLPETQAKMQGRHLITGAIGVLEEFARQNTPVHMLYATARTSHGIRLSRKLGFEEIAYPGDPLIRFKINLLTSDNRLLREYQRIVKRVASQQVKKSDHAT